MKSRRHASVSRQLCFAFLAVILLSSLFSLGWAALSTRSNAVHSASANAPQRGATLSSISSLAQVAAPCARLASTHLLSGAASLVPHLVNLTNSSNVLVRCPTWSPNQDKVAFLANGVASSGSGVLNTQNTDPTQFLLYTMGADGTGLTQLPTSGSVQGLSWSKTGGLGDNNLLYVTEKVGTQYAISSVNPASQTVSAPIYSTGNQLGTLAISPNGLVIYYEALVGGVWNIYEIPSSGLLAGQTPYTLTSAGNNRHPAFASYRGSVLVLYDSDSSGQQAVWMMNTDGTNPTQVTFPGPGDEDSQPQLSINQQYLVFTSNRLTSTWSSTQDTTRNTDIWVAALETAQTLTLDPTVPLRPRFYPDATLTSNQMDAAMQTSQTNPYQMLFVSANAASTTSDIYLGMTIDQQAPYVTSAATASPQNAEPGDTITVSVPVTDENTGVGHVWLQIKSPDNPIMMPANNTRTALNRTQWLNTSLDDPLNGNVQQDYFDQNPLVNGSEPLDPWSWTDVPTQVPVDYELLDPNANQLVPALDASNNTLLTNFPDYYAFATSDNSESIYRTDSPTSISCFSTGYCEEGAGYPEVSSYWIEMTDPNHTGTYSCQWQTPTQVSGDWYFDVIVESSYPVQVDAEGNWHGYRRRFDNIGGCSTALFSPGGHPILFVDEYGDGQRFMFYGVNGDVPAYVGPCFLSTPYYFMNEPLNPNDVNTANYAPVPSPLSTGGTFGGSDLWRILSRGPLPNQVLNAYLGDQVQQINPKDGQSTMTVTHGDKLVFWLAPSTWYRLVDGAPGTGFTGSGSMLDPTVQTQLTTFVNNGGRLFADGFDLPTGLTVNNTIPSTFMQQVFGANMYTGNVGTGLYLSSSSGTPGLGNTWGGNTFLDGVYAVPGWFGEDFAETPCLGAQGTPGGNTGLTDSAGFPEEEGLYREWVTGMYRVAHDSTAGDHAGRDKPHTHFQLIDNNDIADNFAIGTAFDQQSYIQQNGYLSPSLLNLDFTFSNGVKYNSAVQPANTLTWDLLTPMSGTSLNPGGKEAFALWNVVDVGATGNNMSWYYQYGSYTASPFVVGVSKELSGNGRSILCSFGMEHISARYRNRPLHDGLKWLLDGSIIGNVAQNNNLEPIVGALVTVTNNSGVAVEAAHTDANGIYQLQGLHTGTYTLRVSANGFYGTETSTVQVYSQRVTNDGNSSIDAGHSWVTPYVDFFLYSNPQNNSTISGTVTIRGVPVGNNAATVTAVPIGGTGSYSGVTNASGFYSITQLPIGTYNLVATDAGTAETVTVQVTIPTADDQITENIELAPHTPDLLIKTASAPAAAYIGGGIYNSTGANQTVLQVVKHQIMASYTVEIQNNTGASDTFTLFAPRGNSNWTVAYYDSPTNGNNITSQITSTTGWSPGAMATGASQQILVQVTPGANAAASSEFDIPVTISEVSTTTVLDEVIAATQVAGPLSSVTLTASPASPQNMLTPITLTAHALGGASNVFQFVLDGTTIIQDYTASSSCTWIPASEGTHALVVNVKDLLGTNPSTVVSSAPLPYVINRTTMTRAILTATPASPVTEGTTVVLTGMTDGGSNLQFRFLLQSGSSTTPLSNYSASSTCTWVPTIPGTYYLSVEAEDLNATPVVQVVSPILTYVVNPLPLTTVALTATPATAQVLGGSVTLTANTFGGGVDDVYQFQAGFSTLANYGPQNTFTWTPTAQGVYTLTVNVMDLGGNNPMQVYSASITYTVASPLSQVQLSTQPSSPQKVNTAIYLNATPTNGAVVQYRYLVNNAILQDFTASATCTWVPTTPGTYTLQVQAKDISGANVFSNQIVFIVNGLLSGLSMTTNPASPSAVQTPVTITALPVGGVTLNYQFTVDGTLLSTPAASASCVWTPTTVGNHVIQVTAKDVSVLPAITQSVTETYVVTAQLSQVALLTSPAPNQVIGTSISLLAVPTGGANLVYEFLVGGTPLNTYVSSATCTWVPQSAGTYNLTVKAKDLNGSLAIITSAQVPFTITNPLSTVTLTASPAASALVNTPVTLTATATGGANLSYKFYNIVTGSIIQDYSASSTCVWTPSVTGTYQLVVTVHDLHGSSSSTDLISSAVPYNITSALTAVSLSASPTGKCAAKCPVTLTATANGGSQVSYEFFQGSTIIQGFSTSPTCAWTTPSVPGTYQLTVWAKDAAGANPGVVYISNVLTYTVTSPLTSVCILVNPSQSAVANSTVQITAGSVGGANMQFQFWIYNPATPAWTQLQGYSATTICNWVPNTPGNYLLSVTGCDLSSGTQLNATRWYNVTGSTLTAVSVASSLPSPQPVNTSVTFTATASGGTNVLYQFWLYNASATTAWTQLRGFASSPTCTWTPPAGGNYLLSVTAYDSLVGTVVSTTSWYTIAGSLTGVTVAANLTPPQAVNIPVTFTATPTGGTNVQYQFWLYNPAATPAWNPLQAYSSSPTCAWTPSIAGNYLLSVTAQDGATGATANATLWYAVSATVPLSALTVSPSSASPQAANIPITFTALATGGANVQYQFWLYKQNANPAWVPLQTFSSQATYTWSPSVPGSYLLSVTALDGATGTSKNVTLWYTIL